MSESTKGKLILVQSLARKDVNAIVSQIMMVDFNLLTGVVSQWSRWLPNIAEQNENERTIDMWAVRGFLNCNGATPLLLKNCDDAEESCEDVARSVLNSSFAPAIVHEFQFFCVDAMYAAPILLNFLESSIEEYYPRTDLPINDVASYTHRQLNPIAIKEDIWEIAMDISHAYLRMKQEIAP